MFVTLIVKNDDLCEFHDKIYVSLMTMIDNCDNILIVTILMCKIEKILQVLVQKSSHGLLISEIY